MAAKFTTVDEYITASPLRAQGALRQVRTAIRRAVPDAIETIAYNMPAYRLRGASLLQFAAWENHYALYLASSSIVEAFKDELRNCEIEKGTIRFAYADPVPEKLIERIAKFRSQHL